MKTDIRPNWMLNQICRRLTDLLPEDGASFAILDDQGQIWPTDEAALTRVFGDKREMPEELRCRLADGYDPIVGQFNGHTVVATQLTTEGFGCGSLMLLLPGYTRQTTLANFGLIELIMNQATLIAELIDQNNELSNSCFCRDGYPEPTSSSAMI
jgi:hypothetical protein